MDSKTSQQRPLTGSLNVSFALPTDDARTWRMKNGRLTYEGGLTTSLDVVDGYIPFSKSSHGLTVTYCLFRGIRKAARGYVGDVTMMTCVDGEVLAADDIADGVEVIPLEDMPASLEEPAGAASGV
jgi:hypothetical protein